MNKERELQGYLGAEWDSKTLLSMAGCPSESYERIGQRLDVCLELYGKLVGPAEQILDRKIERLTQEHIDFLSCLERYEDGVPPEEIALFRHRKYSECHARVAMLIAVLVGETKF